MELGRYQVSRDHLGKRYRLHISGESETGQTHKAFRVIVVLLFNRRVSHETPLGYTALAA
jgi:hypothetical protein